MPQKWQKDHKTKTAKCKICGLRVTTYSLRCKSCNMRICSNCIDFDGGSNDRHKTMALDHISCRCWCEYAGNWNPNFTFYPDTAASTSPVNEKAGEGGKAAHRESIEDVTAKPALSSPIANVQGESGKKKVATKSEQKRAHNGDSAMASSCSCPVSAEPTVHVPAAEPEESPRKRARTSGTSPKTSPEGQFLDGSTQARGKPPNDGFIGRTTIIIGAGVIGMFIALELAKSMSTATDDEPRRIIIVEINEKPFAKASGDCSGFATVRGVPDGWSPLLEVSLNAWNDLRDTKDFRSTVTFDNGNDLTFSDDETSMYTPHSCLPWLNRPGATALIQDAWTLGRVNTSDLATYLHSQCSKLGVQFKFNMNPREVTRDRASTMSLRIGHVNSADSETLFCKDLIIAAGPWSTFIYSALFPKSAVDLHNYPQHTDWMTFGAPIEKHVGVIIEREKQSVGIAEEISMVADCKKQTVRVSAVRKSSHSKVVKQHKALERRLPPSDDLAKYVVDYFAGSGVTSRGMKGSADSGTAIISTGNGRKPVIGQVLPGDAVGLRGAAHPSGVWLCYGFGNHGTTLAPGVGRLLAQMFRGEKPDADMTDFAVTEQRKDIVKKPKSVSRT